MKGANHQEGDERGRGPKAAPASPIPVLLIVLLADGLANSSHISAGHIIGIGIRGGIGDVGGGKVWQPSKDLIHLGEAGRRVVQLYL